MDVSSIVRDFPDGAGVGGRPTFPRVLRRQAAETMVLFPTQRGNLSLNKNVLITCRFRFAEVQQLGRNHEANDICRALQESKVARLQLYQKEGCLDPIALKSSKPLTHPRQ